MPTLYDTIGSTYAHSRRADPGIVQALARQLRLAPGGAYLDLACGTGNYTAALSGLGGQWSAVDVSRVMLDQARPKAGHIAWVQASASALPFPDGRFDGALCTLAIHHFPDLEAPFAEVRRTLRSGPFVIFTGLAEQMHHYWLCHYFPRMMARAIQKMPSEARVRSALHQAGFQAVTVTPFEVTDALQDLFLYAGKHRPHLYLDAQVRANISSFASLAADAELQEGLAKLTADLNSGDFAAVQAAYATPLGDYAFVCAHPDRGQKVP